MADKGAKTLFSVHCSHKASYLLFSLEEYHGQGLTIVGVFRLPAVRRPEVGSLQKNTGIRTQVYTCKHISFSVPRNSPCLTRCHPSSHSYPPPSFLNKTEASQHFNLEVRQWRPGQQNKCQKEQFNSQHKHFLAQECRRQMDTVDIPAKLSLPLYYGVNCISPDSSEEALTSNLAELEEGIH